MAKIPSYKKDEKTGAVIFTDATAYVQRKKVIQQTKLTQWFCFKYVLQNIQEG